MEKLRLGICDDETQDLAQILEMVKQYDEDSRALQSHAIWPCQA